MAAEYKTPADIFSCRRCGRCCEGFGGTYVSDTDIIRISTYISADPDTFATSYCEKAGSRPVLTRGPDGKCIFFDAEKQCTIHPVKPRMCRTWPFIETLVTNPENWDAMASACPGMKPHIPREMLTGIVSGEIKRRRSKNPAGD